MKRHDAALAQLVDQTYLDLEYRTPGGAARAPVPFVEDGGVLYTQAALDFGGVRWLKAAPQVRVAGRAAPHAAWLEGRARLAWEAEAERAEALLRRKYGGRRVWWSRLWNRLRGREVAVVAVHL